MMNYKKIKLTGLSCSCVGITQRKWDFLMEDSVKANGREIRRLIKRDLPELYCELGLKYYNPYESSCRRTKTHMIYVHSAIEYFIHFKELDYAL
jgi:hypothetical protein